MKDYKLSEVVEICKKYGGNCYLCPFQRFGDAVLCSFDVAPRSWDIDIEPRDMIELPCKIPYSNVCDEVKYFVIYMKNNGFVSITNGYTEDDADKLLLELSNAKSN